MKHRFALIVPVLALFLLEPATASAQFTTFVAPPRKPVDSVKQAIVAERQAQSDSVARMGLTDMKAWVDSAAGVGSTQPSAADTTAPAISVPTSTIASGQSTTTFSNGAVAPDTASPLPAFLLAGVAMIGVGALFLTRRRAWAANARRRGAAS